MSSLTMFSSRNIINLDINQEFIDGVLYEQGQLGKFYQVLHPYIPYGGQSIHPSEDWHRLGCPVWTCPAPTLVLCRKPVILILNNQDINSNINLIEETSVILPTLHSVGLVSNSAEGEEARSKYYNIYVQTNDPQTCPQYWRVPGQGWSWIESPSPCHDPCQQYLHKVLSSL